MKNKGIILERKWKMAFWLSWLVLGAVSYAAWYGWVVVSPRELQEWVMFFQPFPLSLFLSLQVWLGYEAFGKPTGESHRGWEIAFWVNCIPSCFFYVIGMLFARDVHLDPSGVGLGFLLILWIPASLLLVSQVAFAFRALRR